MSVPRGRAIPKAIGAVQVLREGLVKGLEVEYVDVGTERLQGKDGREVRVSTISIRLPLPGKKATKTSKRSASSAQGLSPDRSPLLLDPSIDVLCDL
jgi:hypothetical protein